MDKDPVNFEDKVYSALKKIPKGRISTYKEIAKAFGKPRAARAVGNALNKNPHAPRVPCHRVVKSNGEIGGYARGVKVKIKILKSEGVEVKSGRVIDFEKKFFRFK